MMEKISRKDARPEDWIARLVNKQDEIIDWINEHDKRNLPPDIEKNPKKSDKPKVLRYKLSNDRTGFIAYLPGEVYNHIHSDELTPEQVEVRNQLLEMEG